MSKPKDVDYENYDEKIKEMEGKFGGKWEELCLDLINVPAAYALDDLWEKIILKRDPAYGDWEYPGQAFRHLVAEWEKVEHENATLRSDLERSTYVEKLIRDAIDRHNGSDDLNLWPSGKYTITRDDVTWQAWRQAWGNTTCGFGGIGGQMITGAQTVVVEIELYYYYVYHAGKFAFCAPRSTELLERIVQRQLPGASDRKALEKLKAKRDGGR